MLLPVLLALVVLLVLVVAYSDTRKRQKAHSAALAALQARTAAHAEQIDTFGRALGALVPPDARPTTPHAAAAVDRGRGRLPPLPLVPRVSPPLSAEAAPPSPRRSAEAVERQIAEMAGAPGEPVETEGDREGVNPGDAPELGRLPGETREEWGDRLDLLRVAREQEDAREIRERFQRAADEQDARDDGAAAAPPGDDDRTIESARRESEEPWDERTRIRTRPRVARLATLDGVALERPTSSPARTAAAFEATHGNPTAPAVRPAVKQGDPTTSDAGPAQ